MLWEGRRVLITGSSGYLGHELAKALHPRGAIVAGLDLRPPPHSLLSVSVEADLCDLGAVESALGDFEPQTVFHLAGQSGVDASEKDPLGAFVANVQATWIVLEACRRFGRTDEIVATSSNHVYGHQDEQPTPESAPLNGLGPYGASKACGDIVARCYAETYGLPVVVARITNSFGGADPHSGHLITGTLLSILREEQPVIRGNGTARKAYMSVEDTIEALLLLAESLRAKNLAGEAFNIVPESTLSTLEVVEAALRVLDRPDLSPIVVGTLPDAEESEHLSGQKMLDRLGWVPSRSFEDGLRTAARQLGAADQAIAPERGGRVNRSDS